MKSKVKIRWTIDDAILGIASGRIEDVAVESDYIFTDYEDVVECVEDALQKKYNAVLHLSRHPNDDGDFVFVNPKS